jgi:hypothetical protein
LELILRLISKILPICPTVMASSGYILIRTCAGIVNVAVTILSSIAVLTPNGNFEVVPLLHSLSDIWGLYSIEFLSGSKHVHSAETRNLNSKVLPLPDWSQIFYFFKFIFYFFLTEARHLQSAIFGHWFMLLYGLRGLPSRLWPKCNPTSEVGTLMRRSCVVWMRCVVIYEYEVPGGALNLSSTKLPRPWSPWESFPSRKNPHGRTGNRNRDFMISSQKLFLLDHEAGHMLVIREWTVWRICHNAWH